VVLVWVWVGRRGGVWFERERCELACLGSLVVLDLSCGRKGFWRG